MAENSNIEWTTHTFNPWIGCTKVSPGCKNCLDPATRILLPDMSWKTLSEVKVGDVVYGFDEGGKVGANRLMRRSEVQDVWSTKKPAIEILTKAGRRLVASEDHKWLVKTAKGSTWRETKKLRIGDPLWAMVNPERAANTTSISYQSGYIAGVTAGDGTMRFDPDWRSDKLGYPQMYWRVALSECDRAVLERLVEYLGNFGVSALITGFDSGKSGSRMLKVEKRAKSDLLVISSLLKERDKESWYAGWLAGFLDTDGCASGSMRANGVVHRWSQVYHRNDYLDRTVKYLDRLGFSGKLEVYEKSASSVRLVVSNTAERCEFINVISPALPRKGIQRLYGNVDGLHVSRHPRVNDPIVSLRCVGDVELIDITTSSRTFVAEGVSTHNCYAEHLMDNRMGRAKWGRGNPRQRTGASNWKKPLKWDKRAEQSGKREKVFCSSLADVFDSEVEQSWRDDLFELIEDTTNLDWLLLTKRPENIGEMIPEEWSLSGIPDHVWLGTSVENEEQAQKRIPILSGYDASVKFLSCEPLLSRLEFKGVDLSRINWIIAGGESGSKARPMNPQWAKALRDVCQEKGIPFFFKQWGAWRPGTQADIGKAYKETVLIDRDGREKGLFEAFVPPDDAMMIRVGKKASGCLLEGVEHKEFPSKGGA